MSRAIIQCDDITVSYNNKPVLGPLSLHVHYGDFWGIVGPNGAGKSTMLKTIAGIQKLSRGTINILGTTIITCAGPTGKGAGNQIGMLMQHHDFYPDLPITAEDVVYFGRTGRNGFGRRFNEEDHDAVNGAFEELELIPLRHRPYRDLSGGEKRKIHLARLAAQQAEIILLDEPTAGLDLNWQERLTQLVGDFYHRHKSTILMVTHDVDRLPSCCNKVLLLKGGQKRDAGDPEALFTDATLSGLYDCQIEVRKRMGRYHAYSLGPGVE